MKCEFFEKQCFPFAQFFEEAAECEQWMSRQADSINIRYSDESQSVEMLQTLLRELQELSDQVAEYERRVSSLVLRSREVIPLKQRGHPVFSELRSRCLCIYKQPPVSLLGQNYSPLIKHRSFFPSSCQKSL